MPCARARVEYACPSTVVAFSLALSVSARLDAYTERRKRDWSRSERTLASGRRDDSAPRLGGFYAPSVVTVALFLALCSPPALLSPLAPVLHDAKSEIRGSPTIIAARAAIFQRLKAVSRGCPTCRADVADLDRPRRCSIERRGTFPLSLSCLLPRSVSHDAYSLST